MRGFIHGAIQVQFRRLTKNSTASSFRKNASRSFPGGVLVANLSSFGSHGDLNSPPALNVTKKGGFGASVSHMYPKIDPNSTISSQ